MHYLITGGSGFIGKNFISSLSADDKITILSRQQISNGNNLNEIKSDTKFDCIINLAGSPIDCYWSKKNKQILIDSRVNTTKTLLELIQRLKNKPKTIISASAIGYYGNYNGATLDENTIAKPSFTHTLCDLWEQQILPAKEYDINVCIARLGVVLGNNGGFIQKTSLPFKLGIGGKIASGEQIFSWIHIDDVINGFKFLIQNNCAGTYNFVSPNPCTNAEFTKSLGKVLKKPTIFTMPKMAIKLAFGEMGEELMLKGNNIIPQRLLDSNFKFKYPNIENALEAIF